MRKGAASNSFGLKVAKLAGISNDIIERATKIQNRGFTILQAEANPSATFDTLKQKKTSIPHEIRETNLDKITPLQALNLLQNIKQQYEDEK